MSCIFIENFKNQTFEKRLEQSTNVMKKYNNRCPIIIGKKNSSTLMDISKHKFLSPRDTRLAEFTYIIRNKISLKSHESLFIFFNNKIYSQDTLMGEIYEENKDKDGFLYAVYCMENTFGNKEN